MATGLARAYQEAEGILGMTKAGLMDLKSVTDRYQTSGHRENLSFRHHREVASIKQTGEILMGQSLDAIKPNPISDSSSNGTFGGWEKSPPSQAGAF